MPLARLVKAEIVSPYCGIFINSGVGNPSVPVYTSWEWASFKASGEAFDIHCLHKGIRIPPYSPTPSLFLYPSTLELQRPSSHLLPTRARTKPCTDLEVKASGWHPPSGRRTLLSFGRPGTKQRKSPTVFQPRGKSSPHRSPMRGWYSSPISSAG